jgi:hypothetical membrane protein
MAHDVARPAHRRVAGALPAALLVLAGLALFWGALLVAAAANPAYSHRRDYVSTLAAHGAERSWLGVIAIAAAGAAMLPAAFLVQRLSRLAGLAIAIAGLGFLVVSVTRLDCPNGAAGCGLGGRFEISGSTEISHWTAATVSTVLVVVGIALTGVALLRAQHKAAGLVSLAAAAVTTGAFVATGGQTPGEEQRVGIAVATGWLAALAFAALAHGRTTADPRRR